MGNYLSSVASAGLSRSATIYKNTLLTIVISDRIGCLNKICIILKDLNLNITKIKYSRTPIDVEYLFGRVSIEFEWQCICVKNKLKDILNEYKYEFSIMEANR